MAILLTCPGCARQMTIPEENRGATVRCPACSTLFASVADPYGNPTAFSAAPLPAPRTGPGYVELPAERTDYSRPAPPPPSDLDRRLDADDPLLQKSGPDPVTVFALLGGLVMLVVIVVVFLAFIWPGFLRREQGFANAGPHDLLSLAPADAVLLCGLVPEDDVRGKVLDVLQNAPPIAKELIQDCERVMLAGEFSRGGPSAIAALLTKKPYDRDKIKAALKLDRERVVNGSAIYTMKIPDLMFPNMEAHLAMPDPRVLVVGIMPEADFVKALANQGKAPLVHADLLARARELETSTVWLMLANRGAIKEQMKLLQAVPVLAQGKIDGVLQRCKSLSLTMRPVNKGYHIELGLDCANQADALQMLDFASLMWDEFKNQKKKELDDPAAGPFFRDLKQTLVFERHGTKVIAAANISEKAIQDAKLGELPNRLK